jgi:hypothetical protein
VLGFRCYVEGRDPAPASPAAKRRVAGVAPDRHGYSPLAQTAHLELVVAVVVLANLGRHMSGVKGKCSEVGGLWEVRI